MRLRLFAIACCAALIGGGTLDIRAHAGCKWFGRRHRAACARSAPAYDRPAPMAGPQPYQGAAVQPAPPVAPAAPSPSPSSSPGGDAHGFTAWLNATRAAYGLPAVGYDPNLESWAAMNSAQQAASGIGHYILGPARRQNSAMGGFPGIESMWMASPAHRSALLDPSIRWIGIASYGAYWTFDAY